MTLKDYLHPIMDKTLNKVKSDWICELLVTSSVMMVTWQISQEDLDIIFLG